VTPPHTEIVRRPEDDSFLLDESIVPEKQVEFEIQSILRSEWERRKKTLPPIKNTAEGQESSKVDTGRVSAWVDGVEVEDVLLDSGADDSLVSRGLVKKVKKTGAFVREATPKVKMEAYPVGN
jgi:DNA-binding GntR family transcriptional regulator